MNLEDTLCQIKTNCCNIAHGWLPLLVISNDHHPGTSMPSGGHPPHQLAASFASSRDSPCHRQASRSNENSGATLAASLADEPRLNVGKPLRKMPGFNGLEKVREFWSL